MKTQAQPRATSFFFIVRKVSSFARTLTRLQVKELEELALVDRELEGEEAIEHLSILSAKLKETSFVIDKLVGATSDIPVEAGNAMKDMEVAVASSKDRMNEASSILSEIVELLQERKKGTNEDGRETRRLIENALKADYESLFDRRKKQAKHHRNPFKRFEAKFGEHKSKFSFHSKLHDAVYNGKTSFIDDKLR